MPVIESLFRPRAGLNGEIDLLAGDCRSKGLSGSPLVRHAWQINVNVAQLYTYNAPTA